MTNTTKNTAAHEAIDPTEKRYRKIHMIIEHINAQLNLDQGTVLFDCVNCNRNQSSEGCFTPGDVIVLTGDYRSGDKTRSISVSLQIQNVYIKGERSDIAYPTYFPGYSTSKKEKCDAFNKR